MGVIHHQKGLVRPAQCRQLPQWRDIPIHAEYAVCHHQLVATGSGKHVSQGTHITVAITTHPGAAENTTIDDGGMVQAIREDGIATASQRRDNAHIGHVAGRKKQRSTAAGKFR